MTAYTAMYAIEGLYPALDRMLATETSVQVHRKDM